MSKGFKIFFTLMCASMLIATFFTSAVADTIQQIIPCEDSYLEQGGYGQYYGMSYHSTDQVCADSADILTDGTIRIVAGKYVRVKLTGALGTPFNLYEIYWVPVGGDPTETPGSGTRVLVGQVLTDCNGDADALVSVLSSPSDFKAASPVDMTTLTNTKASGFFLIYNRGPWGDTATPLCTPSNYNTDTGDQYGAFNAPPLWEGNLDWFHEVQFVSGHKIP